MVRSEGAGKVLGTEELEVVIHQKDDGFGAEMAGGGFVVGAQAVPQGRILDSLDFLDIGRGNVWEPDRSWLSVKRSWGIVDGDLWLNF